MKYLPLLFFLCSCGYHFNSSQHETRVHKTISVPYIEGDTDGQLTSTLIQVLNSSSALKYQPDESDLVLKVSLVGTKSEEVGYNQAVQNGQSLKWLVPNESKQSACVTVEVIDTKANKVILGPKHLSSSVYYTYDPNFNVDNLVRFSLAQYNFQEISARIAKAPLDTRLAKTIVNYLEYAW